LEEDGDETGCIGWRANWAVVHRDAGTVLIAILIDIDLLFEETAFNML
jgi:hypothetical protein